MSTIIKVIPPELVHVYPCYLFCKHYCRSPFILAPTDVSLKEDNVIVSMPEGIPLTPSSNVDLRKLAHDIVQAQAYFECYNLIHGDIKPQNIVEYDGNYTLIDFDLLVHRKSTVLTQSFNDIHGAALKAGFQDSNYNQLHQAFYAIAYTLMIYSKESNSEYYSSYTTMPYTVRLCDCEQTIPISTTAKAIHEDPALWIRGNFSEEWHKFILGLIGPDKYSSFAEALKCPMLNAQGLCSPTPLEYKVFRVPESAPLTRELYHYAITNKVDSIKLFRWFNFYYRYDCKVSTAEDFVDTCFLDEDRGRCITEWPDSNIDVRLLLEYMEPGSWIKPCTVTFNDLRARQSEFPDYYYNGDYIVCSNCTLITLDDVLGELDCVIEKPN